MKHIVIALTLALSVPAVADLEQPEGRWVCKFVKKGMWSCTQRYRYDEPLEWKRNPCMGGYKWKCLPR
ncbi:MAG: hypothetical protein V2I24_00355 [Halieaceae bacterium]|jgi:hypothetical protein|nr:hypothetical protein [Halieaceae bacterium]